MSVTTLTQVDAQKLSYWSSVFSKQLRENLMLGSLVNKDYQGEIKKMGDRVRVSQVNAPTGQLLTVGTDADSFEPEAVSTSYVDIIADKRAVASFQFEDLVDVQSMLDKGNPEVTAALNYALAKKINDYLYTLVSPSTSSPDHSIASVSDFNAAQLQACRILAAQAKWSMDKPWYALLDPQFYGDVLNATTLVSSDYTGGDAPVVSGQVGTKRFGFNIYEDNSRSADYGLLFHPDFMHLVMQTEVQTKISDLHANKQFGYVMSVDVIFGAKLGINGNVKHIKVYNT